MALAGEKKKKEDHADGFAKGNSTYRREHICVAMAHCQKYRHACKNAAGIRECRRRNRGNDTAALIFEAQVRKYKKKKSAVCKPVDMQKNKKKRLLFSHADLY